MKVNDKIALRGQVYATPRTESVEITNQGVLCASGLLNASGITKVSNGGTF